MSTIEPTERPPDEPLPEVVHVTQSFMMRLPSQRVVDLLTRIESAPFGDLLQSNQSRVTAFRALLRDNPTRDPTSLWMHAYDVEVQISVENPTNGSSPTLAPDSPTIGA